MALQNLDSDLAEAFQDAELVDDYDEMFDVEDFQAMGLKPDQPTGAKPGSEEKVMMLAARYASGLPLWHNSDCYDHGPSRMANLFDAEQDESDDEFEL